MTQTTLYTILLRLAGFALLVTLAAYCFLGTQARMEADDYTHASAAQTVGVLGSVAESYVGWSGRFAHLLLAGVLWNVFGDRLPALLPTLLIGGVALAGWWALRPMSRHPGLLALALTASLLACLPEAALWQGVYWAAGSLTYVTPLIFWLLCFGCVMRGLPVWLLSLLALLAAGFNETSAALQAIGAVIALPLLRDRRAAALLVGTALGLALLVAAPGNSARTVQLVQMTPRDAGLAALSGSLLFLLQRLATSPVALLLALAAGGLLPRSHESRRVAVMAVAGTLLLLPLTFFPVLYLTHVPPPPRVELVATAILVGGIVLLGSTLPPVIRGHQSVIAVCSILVCLQSVALLSARWPTIHAYAAAKDAGEQPVTFLCLSRLAENTDEICQ